MKRRQALVAAGLALPALGWAGRARAATLTLLAAGPQGDAISRWAQACALALRPGFPGSPQIQAIAAGGLDGVTGANRFDALVPPDGGTAAMLPGASLIAWLAGDSRVHFDPTRWVPVMGATNSGVLVARLPANAHPSPQTLAAAGPLKLAVDEPQSPDLAALLALHRMGVQTSPLFGLRGTDAKTRAFVAGAADAVFLCGEGVPEDVAPLAANGGVAVFSLGRMDDAGTLQPDPLFPMLPDAASFGMAQGAPLAAACAAAAAAARLDFLVALPHLTNPNAIALWTEAARGAIAAPSLQAAADASAVTLRIAGGAAAELAALNVPPREQADLRAFLRQRFGWQAG